MSENIEQQCLFRWAEWKGKRHPELKLMYHIPNEGKRSKTAGGILKSMGLKSGVPDICLPVPSGTFHGLYIEMKVGKNKTTDKQNEWLENLSNQGYKTAVCYGWERAAKEVLDYLGIKSSICEV